MQADALSPEPSGKPCNIGDVGSISSGGVGVGKKEMATHFIYLPGTSQGQRSLVGYSPKEGL